MVVVIAQTHNEMKSQSSSASKEESVLLTSWESLLIANRSTRMTSVFFFLVGLVLAGS